MKVGYHVSAKTFTSRVGRVARSNRAKSDPPRMSGYLVRDNVQWDGDIRSSGWSPVNCNGEMKRPDEFEFECYVSRGFQAMMMSNGRKKGTIEWNCQRSNQIRLAKAAVIVRIARRNAKGGTVLETKLSVSEEEQAKKHTELFTPPPPQ